MSEREGEACDQRKEEVMAKEAGKGRRNQLVEGAMGVRRGAGVNGETNAGLSSDRGQRPVATCEWPCLEKARRPSDQARPSSHRRKYIEGGVKYPSDAMYERAKVWD